MNNSKSTKRTLLASVMALLLCFSMLLGTTFAWFSDTAGGINNTIVAGNLDVELYWSTDAENWDLVEEDTNIFSNSFWEPGHCEVVYLKVVNAGDLAFKYQFGANIVKETPSINQAGKRFKLSDFIKFGVVETDTAFADRNAAIDAVKNAKNISAGFSTSNELLNGDTDYVALVLYMPTTVGNEANYKTGEARPEIKLGIKLVATQYTFEYDGYDNQYDADALACDIIATPDTIDDVLSKVEAGTIIGLSAGTYESITATQNNLTFVSNSAVVGFFDANGKENITIQGVTFDAAEAQEVLKPSNNTGVGVYANVVGTAKGAQPAKNMRILDCTFTGTPVDASSYCPVTFYERARPSGRASNFTVDGCVFETDAAYYIYAYYPGGGTYTVTNNIFGTADTAVSTGVYFGSSQASSINVSGNTFVNCGMVATNHGSYVADVYVQYNHFINASDTDMTAVALRNNFPAGSTFTVEDNNATFGHVEMMDPYVSGVYTHYDVPGCNVRIAGSAKGLSDTLANCPDGTIIYLMDDITATAANMTSLAGKYQTMFNVNGKSVTIELNGKDVFCDATDCDANNDTGLVGVFSTDNNGHLTIQDSVGGATVSVEANGAEVYGLLVNYTAGCSITINGGEYKADQVYDSLVYSGCNTEAGQGIVVKDGTFYLSNVGVGPEGNGSPWIFNVKGQDVNSVVVEGGSFNDDILHQFYAHEVSVDKTLALQKDDDGMYTIVDAVAYVNELNAGWNNATKYVGYATWEEAFAAADDEGEVVTPVAASLMVGEGENLTLNGDGNTLVSDGAGLENIGGIANISNVQMNAGSPADYSNITRGSDAETYYNDVVIDAKGGGIAAADGAYVEFNSGNVAVNTASTSGRYNFYAEGEGSEIVINGGEFSFSKTLNQKRAYVYAGTGTTVTINGGTFGKASTRSGYTAGILGNGTVVIKGGTFGFDPSAWLADGYEAVKNGDVWTVSAINA